MKDNFTNEELYILQDALISYKYGNLEKPCSSTKDKIRIIQKKIVSMENK